MNHSCDTPIELRVCSPACVCVCEKFKTINCFLCILSCICNIVLVPKWIVFGFLCGMFHKSRQLVFIFETDGVVFAFNSFGFQHFDYEYDDSDGPDVLSNLFTSNWRRKEWKQLDEWVLFVHHIHTHSVESFVLWVTTAAANISIQTSFVCFSHCCCCCCCWCWRCSNCTQSSMFCYCLWCSTISEVIIQ